MVKGTLGTSSWSSALTCLFRPLAPPRAYARAQLGVTRWVTRRRRFIIQVEPDTLRIRGAHPDGGDGCGAQLVSRLPLDVLPSLDERFQMRGQLSPLPGRPALPRSAAPVWRALLCLMRRAGAPRGTGSSACAVCSLSRTAW